ncbi:MAG: hypothetical protein JXQ90_13450 [Cyclobacteriaceae bacterium]
MNHKLLATLFLAIFIFAVPSLGQFHTYKMDFYGNQDGLSQSTVNAIIQDNLGYIWFGTQDGLNRFDGYGFTIFRNDPYDTTSISDNFVLGLDKDQQGNLWVGTRGGGVNMYDPRTGKFVRYQHDPSDSSSISHNRVRTVKVDNKGFVWVGTRGGGLNRLDPKTGNFKRYRHDEKDPFSVAADEVYTLFMDTKGSIWVGTTDGLSRYNEADDRFDNFLTDIPGKRGYVRAIIEADDNSLWVGIYGGGLYEMSMTDGSYETFSHNEMDSESLSSNFVFSLLKDKTGDLWVGTKDGQLNQFDQNARSFKRVAVNSPSVRALYQDNSGTMWIGMRHGLHRVNRQAQQFRYYRNSSVNSVLLPSNNTFAVLKDKDNFVWVGSYSEGLSRIDQSTGKSTIYTANDGKGLKGNYIMSLFEDSRNRIWVGMKYSGLYLLDTVTQKLEFFSLQPEYGDKLSINQIIEDDSGNLWFCSFSGLFKLDQQGKIEHFTTADGLHVNDVWSITEDRNGNFWLGLYAAGFDFWDVESNTFEHYENEPGKVNSLSNDGVSQVFEDSNGNIWIAIYGGGLDHFDPETKNFTHYSRQSGLSNSALYGILEDDLGNLWMSHNGGVSKFDPNAKLFINYDVDDGLFGNEFNSGAYFKADDGELFFGGREGVLSIYPDRMETVTTPPPVHINNFSLFNELQELGSSAVLDTMLEFDQRITLDYDQGFFTIGFVALDYANPTSSKYVYKLDGFDEDWISATSERKANYTNVPSGKYTFMVKAVSIGGYEQSMDQYHIVVLTPWWKKGWFIGLSILLSIGILYAGYKFRVSAIEQQKTFLEEQVVQRTEEIEEQKIELSAQNDELIDLNREKNELIGIVSHDLRSPLNQISGFASLIKKDGDNLNDEQHEFIDYILEGSARLKAMINRMLDVNEIDSREIKLNSEEVGLNELMSSYIDQFQGVAERKRITIVKEFADQSLQLFIDVDYLSQIVVNIISNAIKFSEFDTQISVGTIKVGETVEIHIADQGPGLEKEELDQLFDRYKRLSPKPTGGEDSSGIGLYIVKKYVKALRGDVWCESVVGEGSTFKVQLPIS